MYPDYICTKYPHLPISPPPKTCILTGEGVSSSVHVCPNQMRTCQWFKHALPPESCRVTEAGKSCSGLFQAVCRLAARGGGCWRDAALQLWSCDHRRIVPRPHYTGCSESANDVHAPAHDLGGGHVRGGGTLVLPPVQHDTCISF